MADLNMVINVSGQQNIERLTNSTVKLESRIGKLYKSLQSGRVTADQFNAGLKEIRRSVDGQFSSWQKAKSSVDGYVKALEYSEELKRLAAAQKLQAQALKEQEAEAKRAAIAQQALARENERLLAKYNPLYASSKQYERTLAELDTAHERALISTAQHTLAVDKLNAEYQQFVTGTAGWENQFVRGGTRAGKSINRLGMYAQQVGYQVGDFFVQVQSGTNALVAFGQQGTQLAGLLPGIAGAVVGIALSVGTTALLAWQRYRESVKEAAGSLEDFTSALDSVNEKIVSSMTPIGELREEFGKYAEDVRKFAQFAAQEELSLAQKNLANLELSTVETDIDRLIAAWDEYGRAFKQALDDQEAGLTGIALESSFAVSEEALQRAQYLSKQLGLTVEQAEDLRDAFDDLRSANGPEEIADSSRDLLDLLYDISAESGNLESKLSESVGPLNAILNAAGRLVNTFKQSSNVAEQIAKDVMSVLDATRETEEQASGLNQALTTVASMNLGSVNLQIAALANLLGIAKSEAAQLAGLLPGIKGSQSGAKNEGKRDTKPVGVGGTVDLGSSGGSKEETQTMEEYVAALEERLLKERELIGLSEEVRAIEEYRIDLVEDLTNKYPEMSAAAIQAAADEITAIKQVNEELEEKQKQMEEVQGVLSKGFEDFFMSIIDGTKTVGEAFADLAQYIISELLRILVIKPLVDSLASSLTKIFGFSIGGSSGGGGVVGSAQGNIFSSGGLVPFAKGGVVSSPTVFPFANGIGLMGEAGPEAIMPLKRTPSGDLGVIAQGTGGGSPVNVVVNNYGKDDAMVDQQPNGDIVVTVGKAVAQDIANGGATYQAMRKTFGLSQTIKRRG